VQTYMHGKAGGWICFCGHGRSFAVLKVAYSRYLDCMTATSMLLQAVMVMGKTWTEAVNEQKLSCPERSREQVAGGQGAMMAGPSGQRAP